MRNAGVSREKFAYILQSVGPALASIVPVSRYSVQLIYGASVTLQLLMWCFSNDNSCACSFRKDKLCNRIVVLRRNATQLCLQCYDSVNDTREGCTQFFFSVWNSIYYCFVANEGLNKLLKACRVTSPGTSGFTSHPSGCGDKHLLIF